MLGTSYFQGPSGSGWVGELPGSAEGKGDSEFILNPSGHWSCKQAGNSWGEWRLAASQTLVRKSGGCPADRALLEGLDVVSGAERHPGAQSTTCWLVRSRGLRPESQRPPEITQTQAMRTVWVPSPRGATLSAARWNTYIILCRSGGHPGSVRGPLKLKLSGKRSASIPGNGVAVHPEC